MRTSSNFCLTIAGRVRMTRLLPYPAGTHIIMRSCLVIFSKATAANVYWLMLGVNFTSPIIDMT